jgi:flagellar basal body-associated protein FliL
MKKVFFVKIIVVLLVIALAIIGLFFTGCAYTEAESVNHELNKQANYFECERRITVYNARTDKVILEIEGYMNVSNNSYDELVVTCKVGHNE